LIRRPATWVVLVAVLGAGLYWFQPWRIFTSTTVRDQLSVAAPVAAPSSPAAGAATVLRHGSFVTHEHETSGTARLVRHSDGTHHLELAGLDTSDGPDLRVWLTDRPVIAGPDGWRMFDDGRHVELGKLKGNRGDQVYAVPADVDPAAFRSVSIWCKRFAVSFGAASLTAAQAGF
jgi:hypothetical protein